MAPPVVYEYDPATGAVVASAVPQEFLSGASMAGPRFKAPAGAFAGEQPIREPTLASAPLLAPASAAVAPPVRVLSESGKAKVRLFVTQATTIEELADIEAALDLGRLSDGLARRLHLEETDFVRPPEVPHPPPVPVATAAPAEAPVAPPLAALGLSATGLTKVKEAIAAATDMEMLAILDAALTKGDIPRLQEMLELEPGDLKADDDGAETEDEYDPFSTAPGGAGQEAKGLRGIRGAYEEGSGDEGAKQAAPAAAPEGSKEVAAEVLSSDPIAEPPKKRKKAAKTAAAQMKSLAWPLEWAWLIGRTQRHSDFRPPVLLENTVRAQESADTAADAGRSAILALATSMVYVGDAGYGYDPRHLARVVAINGAGEVALDVLVKPRAEVLDYRTHLTGLSKASFDGTEVLELSSVRSRMLSLMRPETVLIGHQLHEDMRALGLWHGALVDVSLLFVVESRQKSRYHPLRFLADKVLGVKVDDKQPYCPVQGAGLALKLAVHESKQMHPTPAFPPKTQDPCELAVRHIPHVWGKEASARLHGLCQGAQQGAKVNWLLNEMDPTDVRGDAVLTFLSAAARDAAFDSLAGMTDVHVQWTDKPGAPPLGALLTEQSLIRAFSRFGLVVCARIPRKPSTKEPQPFAFISFLDGEDAARATGRSCVEVEITPTWTVELKARLAKFGNSNDKRVAAQIGEGEFDWVHISRGQ